MSVSDPLIRELKEWTSKFLENYNINVPITDANVNVQPFCACLEKILTKGLTLQYSPLGIAKELHPWTWLEKVKSSNNDSYTLNFTNAIESVKNCKSIQTATGRLRLLIRICLVKKCIHIPVLSLAQNGSFRVMYQLKNSVLGDEILIQILLSVLLQYSKFTFKLDVSNASFLDISWALPKVVALELVPCKCVGISISFSGEKAIIINVDSNSVAAEVNVETGDILDELNGIHLCLSSRGKLNKIRNKAMRKPVLLKIIKARYNDSGDFYPPIIPLLHGLKIDPNSLINKCIPTNTNQVVKNCNASAGYQVTYVGFVSTGSTGDVKEIDRAIKLMIKSHSFNKDNDFGLKLEKVKKTVNFEIGEIGVAVNSTENNDILLKHSYMEISSCGTVSSLKHYFAYIAGEQICNIAKNFTCYVFHSKCDEHIFSILQSIGQGFQRTHYAV